MPWRGFGIDGDDVRNDPTDADAGQQPQPEHLIEIAYIGSGKGKYPEPQVRTNQCGLAAITVAHPSKNRGAKKNADQARAEYRPERPWRHAPSPDQMGRGESDRSDVIAVDQNDEE